MGSTASIGYIFLFVPKTPKPLPKLLEDDVSYTGMIDEIEDFRSTCRAKNRGKGVVKPFSVQIVDTSVGDSKKMLKVMVFFFNFIFLLLNL